MRRDPGGDSGSWPLLGGAGYLVGPGRPAAEAACPCLRRGLAACGPLCGVVSHWSGEGAEIEGQAVGPCAALARPCGELCAGGHAAPWQQPGPFLGPPCPLRRFQGLAGSCLSPGDCVSAALGTGCLTARPASGGLRVPHLGVQTWGPTRAAPGVPFPCTWGPTQPGGQAGLVRHQEEQGVSLTDLGDPQVGRPVG